jgi:hypothetical protein
VRSVYSTVDLFTEYRSPRRRRRRGVLLGPSTGVLQARMRQRGLHFVGQHVSMKYWCTLYKIDMNNSREEGRGGLRTASHSSL